MAMSVRDVMTEPGSCYIWVERVGLPPQEMVVSDPIAGFALLGDASRFIKEFQFTRAECWLLVDGDWVRQWTASID